MNIRNAAHFVGPVVGTPDLDAEETQDWIASLADVIERDGRACRVSRRPPDRGGARSRGRAVPHAPPTPYRNTIPVEAQPPVSGRS